MKLTKPLASLTLVIGLLSSSLASADHGHVGIGFYFGPGAYYGHPYYPYAYPYPYYAYPPVIVTPAPQAPPLYIEQGTQAPEQSASRQDYYWYHCDKPEGYYPYIKACPGGWQKVLPDPPKQ
ncbi:MAG TPA: hypothetical protein VIE91_01370 [Methylophilaceae bacterium]